MPRSRRSAKAPNPQSQIPELQSRLLRWYGRHGRTLPWRGTRDPYRVWVSEIMLQQTRVETAIPYYQRWLKRFPTVKALAAASLGDVLAVWEGLGYYSRARNLHAAAQAVMSEHGGRLPRTVDELRGLPGVGRYTAGAIASIAFGADAAVLDGNVKRVLARVFNVRQKVNSTTGEAKLWKLAESLIPAGQAGDFNQALMDLGATVCLPKAPDCPACPLLGLCEAQRLGVQEQRPMMRQRPASPHHTVTAGIVRRRGKVLIAQRPADKLLGGLWEFPGGKREPGESLPDCLRRELREELAIEVSVSRPVLTLRHAYTHFKITLYVFECEWESGRPKALGVAAYKWVTPAELGSYAMGKTDRQIAEWVVSNA
jgi:A/G-specific adenine glycosylase